MGRLHSPERATAQIVPSCLDYPERPRTRWIPNRLNPSLERFVAINLCSSAGFGKFTSKNRANWGSTRTGPLRGIPPVFGFERLMTILEAQTEPITASGGGSI